MAGKVGGRAERWRPAWADTEAGAACCRGGRTGEGSGLFCGLFLFGIFGGGHVGIGGLRHPRELWPQRGAVVGLGDARCAATAPDDLGGGGLESRDDLGLVRGEGVRFAPIVGHIVEFAGRLA